LSCMDEKGMDRISNLSWSPLVGHGTGEDASLFGSQTHAKVIVCRLGSGYSERDSQMSKPMNSQES
jgi:hypothetical protein